MLSRADKERLENRTFEETAGRQAVIVKEARRLAELFDQQCSALHDTARAIVANGVQLGSILTRRGRQNGVFDHDVLVQRTTENFRLSMLGKIPGVRHSTELERWLRMVDSQLASRGAA